jgi:hypothetical protein
VRTPRTNEFLERFNKTVLEKFFRSRLRRQTCETVEALQGALDTWLRRYNYERPRWNYSNMGKRPIDTIE